MVRSSRSTVSFVLAFPISNWAPSSTVESFIEATGATGNGRRVTFVCAAGLPHSYMATGALAQSLMLEFTCVGNPYAAYVSERDWEANALTEDRANRLSKTMTVHAELASVLRGRTYRSDWEVWARLPLSDSRSPTETATDEYTSICDGDAAALLILLASNRLSG